MSTLDYCHINPNLSPIICLNFSANELHIFDTNIFIIDIFDTSTLRNDVKFKKYV